MKSASAVVPPFFVLLDHQHFSTFSAWLNVIKAQDLDLLCRFHFQTKYLPFAIIPLAGKIVCM